ncbi:paired amphipathic helix protein Sin3-like protein 4 isoform X2, partial [Tanacetum coccineum]
FVLHQAYRFRISKAVISTSIVSRGCVGFLTRSGQQQSLGGGSSSAQKLTAIDALTYLMNVHDTFRENKDKYHIFLDLLEDFKDKR